METNFLREQAIKWFWDLPNRDKLMDDYFIDREEKSLTEREIESIYVAEQDKNKEKVAGEFIGWVKDTALPETKSILTELKLINAQRDLEKANEVIQELTNAASSVRHLLRACLDDTLPPLPEWIRIRKQYIEFLTPYIEKGEKHLGKV